MGYGAVRPDTSRADPITPYVTNSGFTDTDYYFYFYLDSGLTATNYINIEFPAQYTTVGFTNGVDSCYIDESATALPTCTISGNVITAEVVSELQPNHLVTVKITGIDNLANVSATSYFKIWTTYQIGGQTIDINETFDGIGFGPSVAGMTGSVTVAADTDTVSTETSQTFKFTPVKEVLAGTLFRLTFPDIFTVTSTPTCTATAYDNSNPAIAGTFTCQKHGQEVIIYGLTSYLERSTKIAFVIQGITTTTYVNAPGVDNIYIDTIREDSQLIIERATIATPEIKAGPLINFAIEPYNTDYKFSENNVLWTKLTFGVSNDIPEGGSITVTYGANMATVKTGQIDCWIKEGVPRTASGGFPVCTITDAGTTAVISGFGAIAGGTTIEIVNQNTMTTSNVSSIGVVTKDDQARIIDEDDGTQGAITLDAKSTMDGLAIVYATAEALTETTDIVISFKPGVTFAEGSTIEVYVPTGFELPSGAAAKCSWQKDGEAGWALLDVCSLVNGKLTAVTKTASHDLTATDLGNFKIEASTGNWKTPSIGSSPSYIYEWGVAITGASSSSYDAWGSVYAEIAPAAFETGSGKTEILIESSTADSWTPYTLKFQIDNALVATESGSNDLALIAEFVMKDADDANTWDVDLGTSYAADGSIGCNTAVIVNLSSTATIACDLTIATGTTLTDKAILTVTNFGTISSGVAEVSVLIKNPATADTNYSITLKSQTTDYNGIVTTFQTYTKSDVTITAAVTTDFTTKTNAARTVKTVNLATEFVATLQMAAAATVEKIQFVLPVGYDVDSATGSIQDTAMTAEIFANTYAPTVLLTMPNGINLSDSSTTAVTLSTLKNPAYSGIGNGNIQVSVLESGVWHNISDLDNQALASEAGVLDMTIVSNNLHNNAGDANYQITLKTATAVPAGGEIHIDFPVGYSLLTTGCSVGSSVTDQDPGTLDVTCTVNLLNVKITQFAEIAVGTDIVVYVDTVKNPDISADPKDTATFTAKTIYDSTVTNVIDEITTGKTLTLSADLAAASAEMTGIQFYPTNEGTKSDMVLMFSVQASVPSTGTLIITVPGGYTLPSSLSSSNCILNKQYSSCQKVGNTIEIVPATRFAAGTHYELMIPDVQVPTGVVSTTYFGIKSEWNGLTLGQSAATGLTFTPTLDTLNDLTAAMVFFPNNAAQLARYEFTITPTTELVAGSTVLVWFPAEYPMDLGDISCEIKSSTTSSAMTATCEKGEGRPYVKVNTMLVTATPGAAFVVIINNIPNPKAEGTTGNFAISTVVDNSIVDYLQTTLTAEITALPGVMQVFNITAESTSKLDDTVYTFNLLASTQIPQSTGEVWIGFPDYDYTWEMPGFYASYTCDANKVTASASATWYTPNCNNTYPHKLIVRGDSSPSYNDPNAVLSLEVENVRNPSQFTKTKNFLIASYNTATKSYIERTYGTASDDDLLTFTSDKFQTFIGDGSETVHVGVGITMQQTIRTASSHIPAMSALVFTPTISTKSGDTTGFTITQNTVTIDAGASSAEFTITVSRDLAPTEVLVSWSLTSDSDQYVPPINTMYIVDPAITYPIVVDSVPTLMQGKTSLPIYMHLPEAAAETAVGLKITPLTEGLTVENVCTAAGESMASFTITTDGEMTSLLSGSISIEVDCKNKDSFHLSGSAIHTFAITSFDIEDPGLASFIINSPRSRMQADMTIQVTEPCIFYFTHGKRGIPAQTKDSLIDGATNGDAGYYHKSISSSLVYDFLITGLSPESDYILYGILKDANDNVQDEPFIIEFNTAEYYDSVKFTAQFSDPQPTESQLATNIPEIIGQLVGATQGQIEYVPPPTPDETGSGRRLATYTPEYIFYNNPSSPLPSPQDLINGFAVTAELVANFATAGLNYDATHNLAASVTTVVNPRPTFTTFPAVVSSSNSIQVSMAISTSGTVYVELVGDDDQLPSSRQITELTDAFGNPASITYSQAVTGGEDFAFTMSNLNPASSYTLVVSAKNDDTRLPRIMRDDLMAKLDVLTTASTGTADTDEDSYASVISLLLLWLVF